MRAPRRAEHVLVELVHLDLLPVDGENLDVEAERLHFFDEYLEALGIPGSGCSPFHDRLVDLDPAQHVVGLDGQELLEGVGGTECLKRHTSISPKRCPPNWALPPRAAG